MRRLWLLCAGVIICGCAATPREAAVSRYGVVTPLVGRNVVPLNPHNSGDWLVIASALRPVEETASRSFHWLPDSAAPGSRSFCDILALFEDPVQRRSFRSCLSTKMSGTTLIIVGVRVDRDGSVLRAVVRASSEIDRDVITCIVERILTWRFAESDHEDSFDIPVGIVFVR